MIRLFFAKMLFALSCTNFSHTISLTKLTFLRPNQPSLFDSLSLSQISLADEWMWKRYDISKVYFSNKMIYEYFCKLIFCTQTLFISSERPIALKVVSADTEYSATFNRIFGRIFGRIMPSKWAKIAPIFRLYDGQMGTKFQWGQLMYFLQVKEPSIWY